VTADSGIVTGVFRFISLAAEAGLAWNQLRDLDEAAIAA